MVLVNVHPDYICFDQNNRDTNLYSIELYKELLQYLCSFTLEDCWHALPKEVTKFYRESNDLNQGSYT